MTNIGIFFTFFKIFLSTSISRHITPVFSPVYEKIIATKIYFSIFVQAKYITNNWIFGFTVTAQVTKTDMVQLFKTFFAFIGVKFQDYSKKFDSLLSICRIFTFSLIQEYHFNDHFVCFQHFGLRYHILIVSCTCVYIRVDSE